MKLANRAGIETRNSILTGIAALAVFTFMAIGIAGYVNYYMLLEIPNAPIAQFFSELGLLAAVFMIDFGVMKAAHYGDDDAAGAVAAAWAVAATAWAAALASVAALAALGAALAAAWAWLDSRKM